MNVFSTCIAFCNTSSDPKKRADVERFQHLLVRMMSLLHGSALHDVATLDEKVFEFIDLDGFDAEHLCFMQDSHDPCQVILLWIQRLI